MMLDITWLTTLLLIAIRISWLLFLTPIRVFSQMPIHLRLFWILAISAVIAIGQKDIASVEPDLPALLLASLCECINGLILALSLFAAFAAFSIAGHLIDSQIGLNATAILNPQEKSQEPIMGHLLTNLASIIFFASGFHRIAFQTLALSFQQLPAGKLLISAGLKPALTQFSTMFVTALIIAAPIIFCLLVIELSCGIITRNMPQISVYFVTLPVKILLGFTMVMICLPNLNPVLLRTYKQVISTWQGVML